MRAAGSVSVEHLVMSDTIEEVFGAHLAVRCALQIFRELLQDEQHVGSGYVDEEQLKTNKVVI